MEILEETKENYIKAKNKYPIFPTEYNQRFSIPVSTRVKEAEVLRYKAGNFVSNLDVKVIEFLYDVRFATFSQIIRYIRPLMQMTDAKLPDYRANLAKLIKGKVINRFYLSEQEAKIVESFESHPDDALYIYCMEMGGAFILDSFSDRDVCDWNTGKIIKSSDKISKSVLSTEIYLKIINNVPEKLEFFRCTPSYFVNKVPFKSSFHFCIKENGENKYFIGEIFRSYYNIVDVRERLIKLESLLTTNAYLKYYSDAKEVPVLLIIADTEEYLHRIAAELQSTKLERVRFSVDERIYTRNLDDVGCLLRYNETDDTFKEIKTSIFVKN